MESAIRTLADFTVEASAGDLPSEVADYTKVVLCDTIISGLCTGGLARGDMARDLARETGGGAESLVLGSSDRVGLLGAAYANADLMNLLDADETFFNGAHFAAMSFAPALAEAERGHNNGADLVKAAAISFDVNARLNLGTSLMEYDGDSFRFSQLSTHGYAALGAAIAIGHLRGHSADQRAHALGLATWLAPTAKNGYMSRRRRFNSLKYAANGQIAHAGVTAALMAGRGYEGDLDGLDLQPGFLDAQGYRGGDRAAITHDLGQKWWITETSVKPYPSCRYSHAAIDAVRALNAEQQLDLDDIVGIEIRLGPAAYSISQFREPLREIPADHVAPFAMQFNMPMLTALALLDVPPGPVWHRPETVQDPRLQELASRVTVAEDPVLAAEWRATIQNSDEKVRRTRGSISVTTRTGTRDFESDFAMGDPWAEETRADWAFLDRKFASFGAEWFDAPRRAAVLDLFENLEQVDDVAAELVPLLLVEGER
ncbi:MmgE/PrpD family protein [Nocardioides sp. Bht2]|uniref:MmgE/PrpD family protein n=1 Tax=Nocardioides sp. Bht2 TaxID=3392297 RepID=UPI0039B65851